MWGIEVYLTRWKALCDEIRRKLWSGDVFVDFEHSVNSPVARFRDALGDPADSPRYTETLPRREPPFARALVISGDIYGGRSTYRDFLTLWKNADADIPILQQAKAEFANLSAHS